MLPNEDFVEANQLMKKPQSMPECMDLKVWKGNQQDGTPVIISKWKPSKEDLEELNKGGDVYLYIIGNGMPPVSLQCNNPFYFLDNPPGIYKKSEEVPIESENEIVNDVLKSLNKLN
jgi:hypothetical protein